MEGMHQFIMYILSVVQPVRRRRSVRRGEEQLGLVKQLKCDLVQGFYFAKPVVAADLPSLVSELNKANIILKNAA